MTSPIPYAQSIVNHLADYRVVLEPDENTPEWWAGAPSVLRTDDGTFYLAARMREGNSPRGKRGYEMRILRSADGFRFEPVAHITREAAGVPGFERPALVQDPNTGRFKLYGCSGLDGAWSILQWDDADSPDAFDPATARTIIAPEPQDERSGGAYGYKDPFIFWDGQRWQMFVIGFDRVERIHHFVSDDGTTWERGLSRVLENAGWHSCYTRPACVAPLQVGFLLVYEGSHENWYDPAYNIATGLAYSLDGVHFTDLTPDAPLLESTTPGVYHTWRYSHWLCVQESMYVYFEACRPNNTNEIRAAILPPPCR